MTNPNKPPLSNLSSIAFELFRHWSKKAQQKFKNCDFDITDERILVSNLETSIKAAVFSLTKEEKVEKRSVFGYDYGFFLGYVQSNLNAFWFHEYVCKQMDIYKEFCALKAATLYLKQDVVTDIKMQNIYRALLKDTNLESFSTNVEVQYTSEKIINDIILEQPVHASPIVQSLENRQTDLLAKILKTTQPNYMPKLEKYFTTDTVKTMIDKHKPTV